MIVARPSKIKCVFKVSKSIKVTTRFIIILKLEKKFLKVRFCGTKYVQLGPTQRKRYITQNNIIIWPRYIDIKLTSIEGRPQGEEVKDSVQWDAVSLLNGGCLKQAGFLDLLLHRLFAILPVFWQVSTAKAESFEVKLYSIRYWILSYHCRETLIFKKLIKNMFMRALF